MQLFLVFFLISSLFGINLWGSDHLNIRCEVEKNFERMDHEVNGKLMGEVTETEDNRLVIKLTHFFLDINKNLSSEELETRKPFDGHLTLMTKSNVQIKDDPFYQPDVYLNYLRFKITSSVKEGETYLIVPKNFEKKKNASVKYFDAFLMINHLKGWYGATAPLLCEKFEPEAN